MNILPPPMKSLVIGALGALTLSSIAMAGETAPQFSVIKTSTGTIAAGASAFQRGDFTKSESFTRHALKSGLSKSRKTAAYSNLCAVLGAQGNYADALEACDAAAELSSKKWQIYSNRAAVNLLKGEKDLAAKDLEMASSLSSKSKHVVYNLALLD